MLNFNILKMRYLITVLFLLPILASAQHNCEDFNEQKSFGLGVVPQYAISNGMRIDLDFRLNNKNQWLVVSPLVFLNNKPKFNWDYNSMVGTGIEVQHKLFLTGHLKMGNPYISYGPVFNYFSVKDDGLTARKFTENGGNYIGLTEDEITTKIFKIGGNLIFGLHLFVMDNLYFDTFVGTGIRFAFDNKTTGFHGYYNEWWGDMGYSGTLMVGGFRFGVMF